MNLSFLSNEKKNKLPLIARRLPRGVANVFLLKHFPIEQLSHQNNPLDPSDLLHYLVSRPCLHTCHTAIFDKSLQAC